MVYQLINSELMTACRVIIGWMVGVTVTVGVDSVTIIIGDGRGEFDCVGGGFAVNMTGSICGEAGITAHRQIINAIHNAIAVMGFTVNPYMLVGGGLVVML